MAIFKFESGKALLFSQRQELSSVSTSNKQDLPEKYANYTQVWLIWACFAQFLLMK